MKELIAYNAGMKSVRRPGFLTAEQMGQQSFSHSVNNLFPTLAFIILMIILTVLMIIPTIILNFDLALQTFMFMSRPMLNSNISISVGPLYSNIQTNVKTQRSLTRGFVREESFWSSCCG